MIRYYLDNVLLQSEPKGWEDLTPTIKRDNELNGLLIQMDVTLSFWGDGFIILRDAFYANYCNLIELEITDDYNESTEVIIHQGTIIISDLKIFEKENVCAAKVQDNSYFIKISNNRSIKAKIDVPRSKNDVDIFAAHNYETDLFEPATCATTVFAGYTWLVYDCFQQLVQFMSDGEIQFKSDLLSINTDGEGLMLCKGVNIKDAQNFIPSTIAFEISFEDLFNMVRKRYPIEFRIEKVGAITYLRIELESFFFEETKSLIKFENIEQIETYIDQSKLYAKVVIGSSVIDETPSLHFPETVDILGFREQEFQFFGKCNTDAVLQLNFDTIISSNVIEDIVINGNADHDDDFVLLWCKDIDNVGFTATAKGTDWINLGLGYCYYNEELTNYNTLKRYYNNLPQDIAHFIGPKISSEFNATNLTNKIRLPNITNFWEPLPFENDIILPGFDYGNNYDPTLGNEHFTCPQNGGYVFQFDANVLIDPPAPGLWNIHIIFTRYDNTGFPGGIVLGTVDVIAGQRLKTQGAPGAFQHLIANGILFLLTNDQVTVKISIESATIPFNGTRFEIATGGSFSMIKSVTGGGVYQTSDTSKIIILKHDFTFPIKKKEFQVIKDDATKQFDFNIRNEKFRSGWLSNFVYDYTDGTAKITLNSKNNAN